MIDRSWPPGSADVPVGSHFELVAPCERRRSQEMRGTQSRALQVPARGGGSLMPLEGIRRGRRSAARLRVLLSVAWWPRTRSEVRCGWGLAMWLRTFGLLMGEWGL